MVLYSLEGMIKMMTEGNNGPEHDFLPQSPLNFLVLILCIFSVTYVKEKLLKLIFLLNASCVL